MRACFVSSKLAHKCLGNGSPPGKKPVCATEASEGHAPQLPHQPVLDQVPSLNAHMDRRTRARPCSSSHCLIASSVTVQGLVQEVILSAVEQSAVAMCYMREDLRHDKVSASRAPSLRHTNTAVTSCAIPLSSLASHSHRLALPPRTSLSEHGGGGGCAQRSRPCSRRAGAPSFPPFVLHNVLV